MLPSKRQLSRHKHGNYFPVFVPLWLVNTRSFCPHQFFLSGRFQTLPLALKHRLHPRVEEGGILRCFSPLVPELISSPVQFLTRNIHSLIPIDVTVPGGSSHRPLLWTVWAHRPAMMRPTARWGWKAGGRTRY